MANDDDINNDNNNEKITTITEARFLIEGTGFSTVVLYGNELMIFVAILAPEF